MHHSDDEHLAALGYESEFRRDMSPWANFSLGFTYLSPVVGIYTVFALSIALAGPPMIWSLVLVGIGQFLVAWCSARSSRSSRSRAASIPGPAGCGARSTRG